MQINLGTDLAVLQASIVLREVFFPLDVGIISNKLLKVLTYYYLIYYEFLYEPCSIMHLRTLVVT